MSLCGKSSPAIEAQKSTIQSSVWTSRISGTLEAAAIEFRSCSEEMRVLWSRGLRALERCKAPEEQQEALFNSALAAGMESAEDYLEVSLARIDAVRRKGADHAAELRALFQSTTELMQVRPPGQSLRSQRGFKPAPL